MPSLITDVADGTIIIGVITAGVMSLVGRRSKENDKASSELIANLTLLREADKEEFNKRFKVLEDQHIEDVKTMATMQGQILAYKDIPLQKLSLSMETIAADTKANAKSNAEILKTLKSSAVITAKDKSELLGTGPQNVSEQHVEHQTVEHTE